jgi:membrane protease YdiL (CAAX protease family)
MTLPDFFCVAFIAITLLFDHFIVWRAFLRQSEGEPGLARLALYRALVAELWVQVAGVALLWLLLGRPWALLGLTTPTGWRLWTSLAVVSALALVLAGLVVRLARLMRRRRVKMQSPVAVRSPHTSSELRWWAAVSLSAGFCEELIFRGFLIWLLQPMLGWWAAAGLSLLVFATAHAYQGLGGVTAVAAVGALLTLTVFAFKSLWPAIAIHGLLDLQQGLAAWLVLRQTRGPGISAAPGLTSTA